MPVVSKRILLTAAPNLDSLGWVLQEPKSVVGSPANCVPQPPLPPPALDVDFEREDSLHFELIGSGEELVLPIDSVLLLLSTGFVDLDTLYQFLHLSTLRARQRISNIVVSLVGTIASTQFRCFQAPFTVVVSS